MDDRALLRDLKTAIQSTEGRGAEAQSAEINAVLARHGATVADVQRLLNWAKQRRRNELRSLRQRLDGIIVHRENEEIDVATAEAVDHFLRQRSGPRQ